LKPPTLKATFFSLVFSSGYFYDSAPFDFHIREFSLEITIEYSEPGDGLIFGRSPLKNRLTFIVPAVANQDVSDFYRRSKDSRGFLVAVVYRGSPSCTVPPAKVPVDELPILKVLLP
jgi:hypothetical protein